MGLNVISAHFLVTEDVPDSVAGQDEKLPVLVHRPDLYVRAAADNLLLRREGVVALEGEVTQGAGEGQVAVYPVELDESAGALDPLSLRLVPRLVVHGQGLGGASNLSHAPGVAHVVGVQRGTPGEKNQGGEREKMETFLKTWFKLKNSLYENRDGR